MYGDIPNDILAHVEPVIEDLGFELVDIETSGGTGASVLRIVVDSHAGDGRVPVDKLARMSREIEVQLDAADAVAGEYRLELTSPGLDRVLAREKDFEAAMGGQIKLKTRRPLDGRRRFNGKLIELSEGTIRIEVDGQTLDVPFDQIEKANKIYQFSQADFGSEHPKRSAK